MRHIFIVNTYAGKATAEAAIKELLVGFGEYELYLTKGPKDATEYVREVCNNKREDEEIRFYACGGDGTLKEVCDGAYGYDGVDITVVPLGSGNDFVRYYGGEEKFLDLCALRDAESEYIDLIRVNGELCINVCNFGFESSAANMMSKVRHKKIIGGKNSYITGILYAIIYSMKSYGRICCDGEEITDGAYILCSVANGRYVGGGFKCAPLSINNDGMLDVCAVSPISRFTLARLIGVYKSGDHITDKRFEKIIKYRRCKKVEVHAEDEFIIAIDGEIIHTNDLTCEVVPHAIRFAHL